MTREQIEKKIAEVEERAANCRRTIRRLEAYGASWALDCREMRIAEAGLEDTWRQLAELWKAQEELCTA